MKDNPRAVKVVQTAAQMSGWGKRKLAAGRALGASYTNYGGAHQAIIAEISLDKTTGAPECTLFGPRSIPASPSIRRMRFIRWKAR